MMKNYPVRSSRRLTPWLLLLAGLVLVWLLGRPGLYRGGERVGLTSARAFWVLGRAAAARFEGLGQFFSSRARLAREAEKWRAAAARLEAVALERDRLSSELEVFRGIFNRLDSSGGGPIVVARALTRPSQSPTGIITVDLGADAGLPIAPGDPVVSGGVLVGEVLAVEPSSSKIQLYAGWGQRLEVLLGANRIPAEAIGRGGGNFRLSLPRDLAVSSGDLVVTIRGRDEYPVGRINIVETDPHSAFQEILFRSPINLELGSWLEIHGQDMIK